MSISVPEIIAHLKRATNHDPAIDQFDFEGPQAKTFIAFCCSLYDRGLSHGRHDALDDARLRLEAAGQTAASSIISRMVG